MIYRADIEALRGVAIFGVFLFHLNMGILEGGYAGVDVFFVISGFLTIQSLVLLKDKTISALFEFYKKRFLRIMPAALIVVFIVSFIGDLIFLPEENVELKKSVVSFLFLKTDKWAQDSINYFDIGVLYKPLIHLWSLSVELKFYLLFPVAFLLFSYLRSFFYFILFSFVALLLSFFFATHHVYVDPLKSYFSFPMRLWEFFMGVIIFIIKQSLSAKYFETVPVKILYYFSYLLIFLSFMLFNENSLFPGTAALLPCVGASMILLLGEKNITKKIIDMLLFKYLGRLSYSIYLVHQPVLAFFRTYQGRELDVFESIYATIVCLLLSNILYYGVERLFTKEKKKTTFLYLVNTLICSILGLKFYFWVTPTNYNNQLYQNFLSYRYNNNPELEKCRVDNTVIEPSKACVYGDIAKNKVALWGDSHVDQIILPLSKEISKFNYSTIEFSVAGCPPILGFDSANKSRKCSDNYQKVLNYIIHQNDIKHVVIHAFWIGYIDDDILKLKLSESKLIESFRETLESLKRAGKVIHIIYPVPKMNVDPPLYLARRAMLSLDKIYEPTLTMKEYINQSKKSIKVLDEATKGYKINKIYLSKIMYNSHDNLFHSLKNNIMLYRDNNHLSLSGAEIYAGDMVKAFFLKKVRTS